ncbi:uncharacterized protein BDR25DRAFT_355308 [Lindgomyces ingoldianus]|uniref:Uncharacterized protein n=1 Tax=Lindgomyces ingoldianus TaxID=673940 RepID=A0ACB6QUY5_9PLEO|nr:uncharacterized protein BDR25DRAFT_355308 [Lindgomyces ingoldianus]KAF2470818.1 hypothetical protein BDR25DRAFT_355308 [Lindgomyces ingoldianus]
MLCELLRNDKYHASTLVPFMLSNLIDTICTRIPDPRLVIVKLEGCTTGYPINLGLGSTIHHFFHNSYPLKDYSNKAKTSSVPCLFVVLRNPEFFFTTAGTLRSLGCILNFQNNGMIGRYRISGPSMNLDKIHVLSRSTFAPLRPESKLNYRQYTLN